MRVTGINGPAAMAEQANAISPTDSKSKEYQNQIANAQNRLKDLASDKELDEEEKEKKRKEIQQKITELNNQLRQHQIELRREQQEQKRSVELGEEESDARQAEEKSAEKETSHTGMKAVVSANVAVNHAKAQGHMAMAMEGRVRVLQSEIKLDEGRGEDTQKKQKELQKLQDKTTKVKGAKMNIITGAVREMKQAAENEIRMDKAFGKEKKRTTSDPVTSSLNINVKQKTDLYIKGNMFSNVDFHF